jgi:uncharacterized protein YtpQ (UPF0354 family)
MSDAPENSKPFTSFEFTKHYSTMLAELIPDAAIQVAGKLSLKATTDDDREIEISLDNAFRDYEISPEFDVVFDAYAQAFLGSVYPEDEFKVELHCLVPVIRGPQFIAGLREKLGLSEGETDETLPAHEPVNEHLSLFYVHDSADAVDYLTQQELDSTGAPPERLRKVAVENLHAILPEIQLHGTDGVVMLVAGGNYEASLILYNSLWDDDTLPIEETPIIGVPNRDVLIVTGNTQPERIEQTRAFVEDSFASGDHPISKELFIRVAGGWQRYEG